VDRSGPGSAGHGATPQRFAGNPAAARFVSPARRRRAALERSSFPHIVRPLSAGPTLPLLFAAEVSSSPVAGLELLLVLLGIMAVLVVIARRLQIPYPILLVVGGLGLSLVPGLPRVRFDPELVFVLFLPPLLYPAALFTPWRDFRANLSTILLLAVGLVLVTMIVIAWFAHRFAGMGWGAGFVLGAIVAPSDAVAATAIAHRLRVPRRLVTILEGESLVNDTTAFVAYRFAIAAVVTGSFSFADATVKFLTAGVGGVVVGLAAGWIVTEIQRRLDDPPVQTTLSLLTPFVCYLGAEAVGASGVLAVVICGLYYGWRAPEFVGSRFRLRAGPVWEMVQFLLNGIIFILIGLQLPDVIASLHGRPASQMLGYALAVLVPLILLRLAWLFLIAYAPRWFGAPGRDRAIQQDWRHVVLVGWTGMRGVDSLAAALAVPLVVARGAPFPDRDLIFFLTFAVIFGTLVLQGLSLGPVIRWLGVVDDRLWEEEERNARLAANRAARQRLLDLAGTERVDRPTVDRLTGEYDDRIQQLQNHTLDGEVNEDLFSPDFARLSLEALEIERKTILDLRNRRVINDDALRRVQRDIDLAEIRLKRETA
jgi:CPA1 family monovalent cation:H+ antiporter